MPFDGVAGTLSYAALPWAILISTQDLNVAVISPMLAPRVLNEPIVCVILSAIPNNQNTMVKLSAAWRSEDATHVQLKVPLVRLNG
jgi:hypothetical protein